MEVSNGDPVLLRNDVVRRRLCWDGVERGITPMEWDVGGNKVVPLPPLMPAQERELDGKEASLYFTAKVAESSNKSPQQRRKQGVDWIFAMEELVGER